MCTYLGSGAVTASPAVHPLPRAVEPSKCTHARNLMLSKMQFTYANTEPQQLQLIHV